MFQPVSSQVRFPQLEEEVLRFWKEQRIFEKSLDRPEAPLYSFFEGPPYANASPGIHHVLARAFKDIILRFWSMRGYRVPRRAGWDTHGLPAEIEVEKQLGFTNKRQIEEYGIAEFNARCRENVIAYIDEWNRFTERLGYWVDLDDAYFTFTNDYIESCWWVLKQLWDKDLLYQGYKVTPHCPRCVTSLADHEVAQGYKDDIPDPSVWVRFRLTPEAKEALVRLRPSLAGSDAPISFLAWTTTPWTLPGNVALALAPGADYAVVETGSERLMLAPSLIESVLKDGQNILEYVSGAEIRGLTYEPLYRPLPLDKPAHRIITADWVSLEEGTGIVHIAPAFGEIDLEVGRSEDLPLLHTVDLRGLVLDGLPGAGLFAKDADPIIAADLRQRGLLYREATILHTYPFCWRCDTPLLYYAKTSWYIKTTAVKDKLLEGNLQLHWFPQHIQKGRFGNWLENNIDWAISRERYWGIPLPIWRCEDCGHYECVGSIEEMRARPNVVLPKGDLDLHRPYADDITFACPSCGNTMRRIPEIADVWFDSGAMPYAQWHYPFENVETFKASYPADYISEAIDQTRGWFYTLHALSTLLNYANAEAVPQSIAFRNVLCLELILDAKGEKMSKSKGNTVSPWDVMNAHGADATRWYMFTATPPWVPRRFSSDLVAEGLRRYLLTLWNTYVFFVTYARLEGFDPMATPDPAHRSEMDRWVLARLNQTVADVTEGLEAFNPTDAGRSLLAFVEDLSNWYLRRSRRRFSRNENHEDQQAAFQTFYTVLRTLTSLTAPFTPFVADAMYQNLVRSVDASEPESVHLASWPGREPIDDGLLDEMALVMHVVAMGRAARAKANVKVRQPLAQILVKARTSAEGAVLERLAPVILDELNIKELTLVSDEPELVTYQVKLNMALLGPKYGRQTAELGEFLANLNPADVAARIQRGQAVPLLTPDFHLLPEEVTVTTTQRSGLSLVSEGGVMVAVTPEVTPALAEEGLARELVHRLQNLRRDAALALTDRIVAYVQGDEEVQTVVSRYGETIRLETLANEVRVTMPPPIVTQESSNVDGHALVLGLERVA